MKKLLFILLISLFPFVCFAEGNIRYFNQAYLDKVIANKIERNKTEGLIFDRAREESLGLLNIRGGSVFSNNNREIVLFRYHISYNNYNIILLTEPINNLEHVRDYLLIEKENSISNLASGPVEINGEYFDWSVTVVVNSSRRGLRYTDDISAAFFIDLENKRIKPLEFNTIRLWSEV
ncbi:MAG: hypothetical protein FWC34_00755 [Bacteroidetes bacterium]|nr:hypothetical protein [Bacteroidota bacterium]